MRKAHPWYVERLGGDRQLQSAMQQTDGPDEARAAIEALRPALLAA
jgi:hypothetical protein